MPWVTEDASDILHRLDTCRVRGLNLDEVEKRLAIYGPNEFEEGKRETLFRRVLHHLAEIPTLVLLAAAGVAPVTWPFFRIPLRRRSS